MFEKASLEYAIERARMMKVFIMIFNTMITCHLYTTLQIKYVAGPICIHIDQSLQLFGIMFHHHIYIG